MDSIRTIAYRELIGMWRYRWLAIACAWVLCIGGWVLTSTIPNQYEASARLYVDADTVLTPLLRGLAVDSATAGQLELLQRTLLSRPNLEKLVSKTDLELNVRGPADLERMVVGLGTDIKVVPQTRNLFAISYRNGSPKLAYDVVQTILTTFIESKTGTNRSGMDNAQQFIAQQLAIYERQLRDAEKKRAEFRAKYIDLLPDGSGGGSRFDAAQGSLRGLQGQLQDALAKRDTLTKELTATSPMLVSETDALGGGGGGRPRLAEAERQLQELRLRYTDEHPDVIAQRNLVAAIRSGSIAADPIPSTTPRAAPRNRTVPNPVFEQLKVRVVENDSVIQSLQRQVADAQRESNRLEEIARGAPGLQAEFVNLNRDYDVVRRNYDELLGRRESMRISAAADTGTDKITVQIVDPPQVPQNPVGPKRVLLMSAVLAAGMAGGLALAFLLKQFDTSFHTVETLQDLGVPVVCGISMIGAAVSVWRRAFVVTSAAVAVLLLVGVYGGLVWRMLGSQGLA